MPADRERTRLRDQFDQRERRAIGRYDAGGSRHAIDPRTAVVEPPLLHLGQRPAGRLLHRHPRQHVEPTHLPSRFQQEGRGRRPELRDVPLLQRTHGGVDLRVTTAIGQIDRRTVWILGIGDDQRAWQPAHRVGHQARDGRLAGLVQRRAVHLQNIRNAQSPSRHRQGKAGEQNSKSRGHGFQSSK